MQFSKIASIIAFLGAVSASPVFKRDQATVDADFATLATDVANFKASVVAFKPSDLSSGLAIQPAYNQLDADVKKTTTDIIAGGAWTDAESSELAAKATTQADDVVGVLAYLASREPDFASGGFNAIVLNNLKSLKTDFDSFAGALQLFTKDADRQTFTNAKAKIQTQYEATVTAFGGTP